MRIAITHPTSWPEVRRGSERMLNDAARVLAARGHRVTTIATRPGEGGEEARGAVRHLYLRRREPPAMLVRTGQLNFFHGFAWDLRRTLAAEPFDAVLCLGWHDALGALAARRAGARFRLVVMMTGIPFRRYFRRTPLDGLLFGRVLAGADEVLVISRYAQASMRQEFGRVGTLLPPAVDTAAFAAQPKPPSDGVLRVLFVGDADEPRKGAVLLAAGYARARPALGAAARLEYSGRMSAATQAAVLAALPEGLRGEAVFHGIGDIADLPGLMARASVVANPAVWEALGMVLIEALAAGTPVVGCDHGGIPDIIDDPRIGALFPPGPFRRVAVDAEGLAAALRRVAALAADPGTAALCRASAQRFSWDRLAPRYEALLAGEASCTSVAETS